jgi:hypothetical protein
MEIKERQRQRKTGFAKFFAKTKSISILRGPVTFKTQLKTSFGHFPKNLTYHVEYFFLEFLEFLRILGFRKVITPNVFKNTINKQCLTFT